MSKVKQVVEEKTNTTAPVQKGFKSLMSKVKPYEDENKPCGITTCFKSLMSKVKLKKLHLKLKNQKVSNL